MQGILGVWPIVIWASLNTGPNIDPERYNPDDRTPPKRTSKFSRNHPYGDDNGLWAIVRVSTFVLVVQGETSSSYKPTKQKGKIFLLPSTPLYKTTHVGFWVCVG